MLKVGLGRNMTRGTQEVVRHGPMAFASKISGATPPICAWANESVLPVAERNSPSDPFNPSETAITHWSCRAKTSSTLARNLPSSNVISGKSRICGASPSCSAASAEAAVVQPACRTITSTANTFVEVRLIAVRSNAASRTAVATYFAAEPNPGEQSVIGRSLSIVLGMPTHTMW